MAEGRFISYLRVSTDKQGRSGLGIEAQREAVVRYHDYTRHCRGATCARHQGSSWRHVAPYGRRAPAQPALTIGADTSLFIGPLATGAPCCSVGKMGPPVGPPTVLKSRQSPASRLSASLASRCRGTASGVRLITLRCKDALPQSRSGGTR
jgi:hypothetical protein